MSSKTLKPIEILQRRKIRLQVKTDALTTILEENFVYLQDNAVSLVGESSVNILISKMPPFVQGLLGRKKSDSIDDLEPQSNTVKINNLVVNALDVIPFFIRGKKGLMASLMINLVKKFLK